LLPVVIRKIISGGQTGADRAAFDAALALGLPIGGWVPKGRKAEDGVIPAHYSNLRETDTDDYESRTRLNVREADATLILSHGPLTGGSQLTESVARTLGKPFLHVNLTPLSIADAVDTIRVWLSDLGGEMLNVAGPRASNDPLIYDKTREIVTRLIRGVQ
jgi:hypothetical protein